MDVNVGKGITLSVDTDAMPEAAMAHVVYIGLRNILQDAHAGESDREAARALAEKKLAALMRGEVRVHAGREGDPVKARAKLIATGMAKKEWVKAGRKLKDMTTNDVNAIVAKIMEKRGTEIVAAAQAAVAAEAAIPDAEV